MRLVGTYRLLRPIGEGGIGQVFEAVHEGSGRRAAIKLLSPESAKDPQLVARFLQEGRALGQLDHPGIVRVYDSGMLEDGTAYLAMEHLDGQTLQVWMRKHTGPVPLDVALHIAAQLADALVAVRGQNIVHRDLKPSNIVLVPDDNVPSKYRCALVDFGIAKVPPPRDGEQHHTQIETAQHSVLGTAAYMAPEQSTNATGVDVQADVYAFGLILFELLAGRPPFVAADSMELLLHHVNTPPPSLCDLAPETPPLLGAFVASMLAKAPQARPTMRRCRDMFSRSGTTEVGRGPFPGLQPFADVHAELFFGRESELQEVVTLVQGMREEGGHRWLQIEGPSGAGKSSLVQAGVLPQLDGEHWIRVTMRPADDPIGNLARAIVTAYAEHGLKSSALAVESALRSEDGSILDVIGQWHPPGARLLLVIEQLEEALVLGGAPVARLDGALAEGLEKTESPLRLLTTVRSDYLHRLEVAPRLARLLNRGAARYHLHPMREEALARVVRGMATRAGLRLSEELARRIVLDAASAGGPLPLLGHALQSLWSARSEGELTFDTYERMGGVSGALERQAAHLIETLDEDGRQRAKWLVLDLVQVGRGAPDTRRPRTRGEVLAAAGGGTKAEEILAHLAAMRPASRPDGAGEPLRLVVISGHVAKPSAQRVDLIHDALLHRVPIIAGWIEDERGLLERHADLELAAQAWEIAGSPLVGLPSGSFLDHYRGYASDPGRKERLLRMASARARRFLDSAELLERRRHWRRRALVAVFFFAALVTSAMAFLARRERERAEESLEKFIATTDEIVSDADWQLGRLAYTTDTRREMLKSIERNLSSLQREDRPEIRRALIRAKHRRSDLARQNETLTAARTLIDEARTMIDVDLKSAPEDRDLRKLLALNLSKRGKILLAAGRHGEALEDFSASVTLLATMGSLDDADDRRTLATSYSEQAEAEAQQNHFAAAERLHSEAARLIEKNPPTASGYDLALLASTLTAQADAARNRGDLEAAVAPLDRAERIQQKLANEQPGNLFYRLHLGQIHASLAALHLASHRLPEADHLYVLAIEIGASLHQSDPTQKEYGMFLCQGLIGEEAAAAALGDTSRSLRARDRRCMLARRFMEQDPEDHRFRGFPCP